MIPKKKILTLVLIGIAMMACAQVPKQSVELLATVGRNIAEMHRTHRELGVLLYDRMISDINRETFGTPLKL
jgi:hypothetical protein